MGECRLRESKDTSTDDTDDSVNDKRISSSDDTDDGTDTIIPAQCDSDSQCSATIQSQEPAGPFTGVSACQCYSASYLSPFDECEGNEHCRQVRCVPGGCDDLEAYCDIAPDDNGMGQCQLRSTTHASVTQHLIYHPLTSVRAMNIVAKSDVYLEGVMI
eukprot:86401_1